ncbi:MAG: hypothetical protein IIZ07_07525, partial [Ruminococcus sp.]|nr:hypothetical protein [Ruminococcus sp.]
MKYTPIKRLLQVQKVLQQPFLVKQKVLVTQTGRSKSKQRLHEGDLIDNGQLTMDNFGREEKFYTIYAFVPDWINMDIVLVFPDCCGAT